MPLHKSLIIALICTIVFFCQCTTDKKVNSEAVQDEMSSREAIKVSEAEIMNQAQQLGSQIAGATKQTLGKNLQAAIQDGGIENAIGFCNLNAMPLVDSLNRKYGARIRRVSSKVRNPVDRPVGVEQEILEAYEYQWQDSVALDENIQVINENEYLFTKPIMVDNALCLYCHGKPSNGLTAETEQFIKSKYPDDEATGYEIGDLRGMWSITIPKKNVVLSME
jgi:hypothetical protein